MKNQKDKEQSPDKGNKANEEKESKTNQKDNKDNDPSTWPAGNESLEEILNKDEDAGNTRVGNDS